jgi:hypothetical protein
MPQVTKNLSLISKIGIFVIICLFVVVLVLVIKKPYCDDKEKNKCPAVVPPTICPPLVPPTICPSSNNKDCPICPTCENKKSPCGSESFADCAFNPKSYYNQCIVGSNDSMTKERCAWSSSLYIDEPTRNECKTKCMSLCPSSKDSMYDCPTFCETECCNHEYNCGFPTRPVGLI